MEPIRNASVSMLAVSVWKWYHSLMSMEGSAPTDTATGFSFYKGPHNANEMTIIRWTTIGVALCWEQPETQAVKPELWGHHNYLHPAQRKKVTSWVVWHSLCTFPTQRENKWIVGNPYSLEHRNYWPEEVGISQTPALPVRALVDLQYSWKTRADPPPISIIAKL